MWVEPKESGVGDEAAELTQGIILGLDPQPLIDFAVADGVAVTRPSSWWNHLTCGQCGHTFRRGDRVVVNQQERAVVHLVPALGCAQPADVAAHEEITSFAGGLL